MVDSGSGLRDALCLRTARRAVDPENALRASVRATTLSSGVNTVGRNMDAIVWLYGEEIGREERKDDLRVVWPSVE